jgi:hypothetical protein
MLRLVGVATFSLSFLLLAVVSGPCANANASASEAPGHFSFLTWLQRLTNTAIHRPVASWPPLPRPRPVDLAPATDTSNRAPTPVPLYD